MTVFAGQRFTVVELENLVNPPRMRTQLADNQTVAHGSTHTITWPTPEVDTSGMWNSANPGRGTIQVAGWYDIVVNFDFGTGTHTRVLVRILKNFPGGGSKIIGGSDDDTGSAGGAGDTVSGGDEFAVDDWVSVTAFQQNTDSATDDLVAERTNLIIVYRAGLAA